MNMCVSYVHMQTRLEVHGQGRGEHGLGVAIVPNSRYKIGRMHASAAEFVLNGMPNVTSPKSKDVQKQCHAEAYTNDQEGWNVIDGVLHLKSKLQKSPCLGFHPPRARYYVKVYVILLAVVLGRINAWTDRCLD